MKFLGLVRAGAFGLACMGCLKRSQVHFLPASPTSHPVATASGEQMKQLRLLFAGQEPLRNAGLIIRGTVTDESGTGLSGVRVTIVRDEFAFFDVKTRTDSCIVDSPFLLTIPHSQSADLYFNKSGYYRQRRAFSVEELRPGDALAAGADAAKPVPVSVNDVHIVMEKISHLAPLVKSKFHLADGGREGLAVSIGRDGRSMAQDIGSPQLSALGLPFIHLEAERDSNRRIVTFSITATQLYPRRLALVLAGAKGGFITFEPESRRNVYHQMRTAPTDGYAQRLVIDETRIRSVLTSTEAGGDLCHYFYAKIGARYGKGFIRPETCWPQEGKATALLELRLQTEDSRNLESAD